MKKYELTTDTKMHLGKKLFRIRALISFGDVEEGDLGGYIEKEENLDQSGNAWVGGNARVGDNAWVGGNAWVGDNAWVGGDAWVGDNAWVRGDARVGDNAWVGGDARVDGNAWVRGNAWVGGDARVDGNAWVRGNAWVGGNAWVDGNAWVRGDARVGDNAWVRGDADYTTIHGFGSVYRTTTFFRQKDGSIGVKCGCFSGTLEQFREKVKETHGDSKFAKEYLMAADLMELHFCKEE